jgi:isoleucyl-tRNA synthetase
MKRTPELIDVWFDSGAMPFAQWHYPFENRELFSSRHPADYICEGIDQTRGWFYSLHAISTFLFDKPAYKNLIVNELILDNHGQKMSKSKGNTVDPFAVLGKYGADTTRWYLVATSPPWRSTLFDESGLGEVQRKFLGTLLNTYAFFTLYANIDGFTYAQKEVPVAQRPEIDRWILSALNSLEGEYVAAMDAYDVTKAARAVSDFTIDQLSNWYVRLNRRRFWKNEEGADKEAAYQTLYQCLTTITKLAAPFAPFLMDAIYGNLNRATKKEEWESVHLSLIPSPDPASIDSALEARMGKAQRIVSLVRSLRNKSNLKVRQPLRRIIVPVSGEHERAEIEKMEDLILDEVNVKSVEYVTDESGIVHKSAKPNFKALGPKHGKSVQAVAQAVKQMSPAEIRMIEERGEITLNAGGSPVTVAKEDVEIVREDLKGWLVESENGCTVALDVELTPELVEEGLAREFVNRVQNMRKDAGFDVTDRIRIFASGKESLNKVLQQLGSYIRNETLAVEIADGAGGKGKGGGYTAEWDINGEQCTITIEKVGSNGSASPGR